MKRYIVYIFIAVLLVSARQGMGEESSASYYYNDGIKLLELGLFDQAIDSFEKAKKIYLVKGMEAELGGVFFNLGKCWYEKKYNERALNFYTQSERILLNYKDYVELSNLYNSLGVLHENYLTEEGYIKALEYYNKSEALLVHFRTEQAKQESLNVLGVNKGKLYERWGKYDQAYNEYLKVEKNLSGKRPKEKAVVYNNLAYVSLIRKDYKKSLNYALVSLESLEYILSTGFYISGANNLQIIDRSVSPYSIAVESLVRLGKLKQAYTMKEKGRNRFFQYLVRIKTENANNPEADRLWQKKLQLDKNLSDIEKRALQSESDNEKTRLFLKTRELNQQLQSVIQEIFSNSPAYNKVFSALPLDVTKVQRALNDGEALLDYDISARHVPGDIIFQINVFLITKEAIKHIRLFEGKDAFNAVKLVKEYNSLLRPEALQEYYQRGKLKVYKSTVNDGARKLYKHLLEKIDNNMSEISRLFIIPHTQLNFLPFESLIDNQNKLIVEKYAINYLNSASELLQPPVIENNQLLIFGDVDYGSRREGFRDWPEIPGSSTILNEIVQYIEKDMPVKYVNRAKATESHFKESSTGQSIILLWTHGEFSVHTKMPEILRKKQDEKGGLSISTTEELEAWYDYQHKKKFTDPLSNSFVALAGVNQGGDGRNNGYLTAREVMNLNLKNTELTILAACETGVGESSASEGVLGLRRAFSVAGSRQLLNSLWQVDAKWTGELLKLMLGNYRKSGGMRALQQAKLSLIKKLKADGLEPYPFYWAGFVLSGK